MNKKTIAMNLETRKISIISWISSLQDEDVVSKIEQIQSQRQDWWNLISDEEKQEIEEGLNQADRGELKSTDEVLAKYKR